MNNKLPHCPMEITVNLVGNKWKPLIVQYLLDGKKRFGELKRDIPNISQKVLADNLRSMENNRLITREVFAEVPTRVEYSLTDMGMSLKDVVEAMQRWGVKYQNQFGEKGGDGLL